MPSRLTRLLVLFIASASSAAAQTRMSIAFSPTADSAAPLAVSLTLKPRADTMTLQLPNEWAGRNQLFKNIADLATPTAGARIEPTDRPDQVRLVANSKRDVTITWRIKATAPSSSAYDGHNHSDVSPTRAQVIAHDALVLPALDNSTPVAVDFAFSGFDKGAVIATSFGPPSSRGTLSTRTELGGIQHASYVIGAAPGSVRSYKSKIAGGDFTILIRGHLSIDDSTLVRSVTRVVEVERAFWRTPTPPHYLVSIGVAPRGTIGGQRLYNTFVANIDSTRGMDDNVTTLFAHELMHEWIGSGLLSPSPSIPDGTISWFTEGFNEFTTHRVMRAAGLTTDSAYLATVNKALREQAMSPARDSAWPAIVNGYWRDGSMQRQPYLRGELIGLQLNAAIVRATRGKVSLDTLLRRMTSQRNGPAGFTFETLVNALGADITPAAARALIDPILAGGPITLSADALGACVAPAMVDQPTWDPGFDVDGSLPTRRVTGVRTGGPAHAAGLRDSMALAGVDISRGDPTRQIRLRIRNLPDTTRIPITYMPLGKPVTVQQWTRTPGCV